MAEVDKRQYKKSLEKRLTKMRFMGYRYDPSETEPLLAVMGYDDSKELNHDEIEAVLIKIIKKKIHSLKAQDLLLMAFGLLLGYEGEETKNIGARRDLYIKETNFMNQKEKDAFAKCKDDKERKEAQKSVHKRIEKQEKTQIRKLVLAIAAIPDISGYIKEKNEYYDEETHSAKLPRPNYETMKKKTEVLPKVDTLLDSVLADQRDRTQGAKDEVAPSRFWLPRKRLIIIFSSAIVIAAILLGIFFWLCPYIERKNGSSTNGAAEFDTDLNQHMLLKLQIDLDNARHLYEMGLNNWKRLDYPRAEHDIYQALKEISEYGGQSTLELAKINNSIGCLYLDMGKYPDAYDYLNSAHIAFRNELGSESLWSRAAKFNMAQYDYYTGDFERALRELQEIIDNSDAENEKVVIVCSGHLRAKILDAQGKYDDALETYQDVLNLYQDIIQDGELSEALARYTNDPKVDEQTKNYYTTSLKWIIHTYNNIGKVYIHMEEYDKARTSLNTALKYSLDNIYIGKKNLTTASIYSNLAIVMLNVNQKNSLDDAIENVETSIAIQRGLFDYQDTYPGLVEAYEIFARIYDKQNDPKPSESYLEAAMSLAEVSFGEYHPQTANICNAWGLHYTKQGQPLNAIVFFERAISIRKNSLILDHPDTATYYLGLALAYEETGDVPRAVRCVLEINKICEKLDITGKIAQEAQALHDRLQ